MRLVMMCLLITLLTGCLATKTVTQYQYEEVVKVPSAVYLQECIPPFDAPPATYGEAVIRDEVWLNALRNCGCRMEKNREFYGYSNKGGACDALQRLQLQPSQLPPTNQTD